MAKDSWDIALVILTGLGALFTGVAAVATAFAARAAYRAADVALEVARADADRELQRSARRSEVHAAYMLNETVLVYGFVEHVKMKAELVNPDNAIGLQALIQGLAENAKVLQGLVEKIPALSISELPEDCAAATAGAISGARTTIEQAIALGKRWEGGFDDMDHACRIARIVVKNCDSIRSNLRPYLKYAREHFGSDLE